MKVSVIVPTYKDLVALRLILSALEKQTYKNFEVLITEDDDAKETNEFLESFKTQLSIKHFQHKDSGNRKAIIMNKALPHAEGEYLIFIDGDVVPYTTFVESHVALSEKKTVLCGRRVNLGDKVSKELREGKITSFEIEKKYFRLHKYLSNDNLRHYEQGIRFKPESLMYKLLNKNNKNIHILGSNFSCYRDDLFKINGFDEDITGTSKDDVDLEWRLVASGCKLKSCKYCANLFHLNHSRKSRAEEEELAKKQMQENKKKNKFICSNGIKKDL